MPRRSVVAVIVIGHGAAFDPSCWTTDFSERDCCSGLKSDCWDAHYTFHRCCEGEPDAIWPLSRLDLTLGATAAKLLQTLHRCWPKQDPTEMYEQCCGLHHGLQGNKDCWSPADGVVFEHCCEAVVSGGLDMCTPNSGMWCTGERIGYQQGSLVDHRAYVGRLESEERWLNAGQEQFQFLRDFCKVQPDMRVLDIGCGSLRLGKFLIPYLEPGSYLGMDKSRRLIEAGWQLELGNAAKQRRPCFVVSDNFEMELFKSKPPPDISIAISLMTHLNHTDIQRLLQSLRGLVAGSKRPHRLVATVRLLGAGEISEALPQHEPFIPAEVSNSMSRFYYELDDLRSLADMSGGWTITVPNLTGTPFKGSTLERGHRVVIFHSGPGNPREPH